MKDTRKMTLKEWIAILGGALGAFMAILDIQVTNASLREISGALSIDVTESGWISSAYLIAEIIVIPLTALAAEISGIQRYIIFNGIAFVIASILCGLSWNSESLIFFRVIQGLTGGTLIPMSFQLILKLMPDKQRTIGITLFGLTITLAPTLGPSLGGWLTEAYGWRSIFFINFLPGILLIWAIRYGVMPEAPEWENLKKIDFLSVLAMSVGLGSLTYVLEEGPRQEWFDSAWIRTHTLSFLIFLPFFIFRQFEIKNPLLKLSLLKDRNFALGTAITTLAGCALFSGIYSLSLFLGQVKNYASSEIGQILMWVGLPQAFVMPLLPLAMKKVDLRLLALFGLGIFAYSNALNVSLSPEFQGDDFRHSLLLRAIGQPFFVIPLSVMAMSKIRPWESGDASAIFNVMRNLGASLGIALTSTFLLNRQALHFLSKIENISSFDFGQMERYLKLDYFYRSQGLDSQAAHLKATSRLLGPLVQTSIVDSFGDIYLVLTWILTACLFFVLFMKKTEAPMSSDGVGH